MAASWRGGRGRRRLSALAFAPLDFFPALLLGFAVLALLLDIDGGMRRVRRFDQAWPSRSDSSLLDCNGTFIPFWSIKVIVSLADYLSACRLLPLGLGLFRGVGLCRRRPVSRKRRGSVRIIVLAICWAAGEWLRGHLLTGFPWNLPAYGWGASLAVLQSAALVGAYGLSFLTILLGVSLAEFSYRRFFLPAVMTLLLFLGLWGFGAAQPQQSCHRR